MFRRKYNHYKPDYQKKYVNFFFFFRNQPIDSYTFQPKHVADFIKKYIVVFRLNILYFIKTFEHLLIRLNINILASVHSLLKMTKHSAVELITHSNAKSAMHIPEIALCFNSAK